MSNEKLRLRNLCNDYVNEFDGYDPSEKALSDIEGELYSILNVSTFFKLLEEASRG